MGFLSPAASHAWPEKQRSCEESRIDAEQQQPLVPGERVAFGEPVHGEGGGPKAGQGLGRKGEVQKPAHQGGGQHQGWQYEQQQQHAHK